MAELLRTENKTQESIGTIKNWLSDRASEYLESDQDVYFLYLDLIKAENQDLKKATEDAIFCCPTSEMMQKIAVLLPNNMAPYEKVLESKDEEEMLDYLEASGRLEEGLKLIKRSRSIWEPRTDEFFKKHKKKFPEEAKEFFCALIDKNLQHTGDRYYYAIADALEQMRKIDAHYASFLLADIRLNYKRRRKLMTLLLTKAGS